VSSYSLVNPLIAVGLGLATGEKTSRFFLLGSPLVLAGLALILYGDAIKAAWGRGNQVNQKPG
jgi:drug/metabolite transporter (DMT)-like permease